MDDQKLENLLNLAMGATEEEREKSLNLNVGFDENTKRWEVLIKYSGPVENLTGEDVEVVPLLGGYAVVTLPENKLKEYGARPQIEFIEKPKRLYFSLYSARRASCITPLQTGMDGLSGQGILMGIVDSGVDYRHPDFRNADGTTRILKMWDQGSGDRPPAGYLRGTEYTQEQINEALKLPETEGFRLVPERDFSGHGTSVLGIAAGNGRASAGEYRGVAYESELLVVKLGIAGEQSFPRTTELLQGIDYLIRQAQIYQKPIVINVSFGNNYGSHRGDSLLETYIDQVSNIGRNVICVGSGNNGADNLHTSGQIGEGEIQEIELGVSPFEPVLNVQLWKSYADQIEIYLENPSGERIGPLYEQLGAQRYHFANTEVLIYYGKPAPFQLTQEIYFDFLPDKNYVDSGVWKFILKGENIKEGVFNLWLPGGGVLNPYTGFFFPKSSGTLTIPSTASRVITVGAYDSASDTFADFSGRGSDSLIYRKPDLVAPGVAITAPVPGSGYASVTGTSFATPFVSGAAALLMEWGIVKGNDPFLYGEKVKAYLQRGARALPGYSRYPNALTGFGALCVRESIPG